MVEFMFTRRTALQSAAAAALVLASVAPAGAAPLAMAPQWQPNPATDGLKAFEGIEADRGGKHPERKYVVIEGDHWKFNIWKDDRDTTGGGDRQRTESKGMVASGAALKMKNGETWTISYEMFMPSTLHGTSKFTHIFQTKTPKTNGGPWTTLSLGRSGSKETIRARAFSTSGAPDIASTDLAPLRDKWVTVEWTITPGSKGTVGFVIRNGTGANAPIAAQGRRTDVRIPDEGDYIRPKWGIYRSVESASSDILTTYINFRNYQATKK